MLSRPGSPLYSLARSRTVSCTHCQNAWKSPATHIVKAKCNVPRTAKFITPEQCLVTVAVMWISQLYSTRPAFLFLRRLSKRCSALWLLACRSLHAMRETLSKWLWLWGGAPEDSKATRIVDAVQSFKHWISFNVRPQLIKNCVPKPSRTHAARRPHCVCVWKSFVTTLLECEVRCKPKRTMWVL